eukprot:SAG22_NODE_4317_length_1307_cov_0.955298_2_plen_301_part_01
MAAAPSGSSGGGGGGFVVEAVCGQARAGRAFGGKVATPHCMLVTKNAALPHMSPDQVAEVLAAAAAARGAPAAQHGGSGSGGAPVIHVCALDLWNKPGAKVLAEAGSRQAAAEGGGSGGGGEGQAGGTSVLGRFCGLQALGPHSPVVFLSANRPYGPSWAYGGTATNDHVCGSTSRGMTPLRPAAYLELVQAAAPHAFDALSDAVAASCSNGARCTKSVDRTIRWLDEQLAAKAAAATAGQDKQLPPLFGVVQGGGVQTERVRCAAAVAARAEQLAGFALGGFGRGEQTADKWALLEAAVA